VWFSQSMNVKRLAGRDSESGTWKGLLQHWDFYLGQAMSGRFVWGRRPQ
jgi:hypothetical protein